MSGNISANYHIIRPMKKVIIYTGDLCIHCDWAIDLLNRKKIQYTEFNVAKDLSKREEMLKKI